MQLSFACLPADHLPCGTFATAGLICRLYIYIYIYRFYQSLLKHEVNQNDEYLFLKKVLKWDQSHGNVKILIEIYTVM